MTCNEDDHQIPSSGWVCVQLFIAGIIVICLDEVCSPLIGHLQHEHTPCHSSFSLHDPGRDMMHTRRMLSVLNQAAAVSLSIAKGITCQCTAVHKDTCEPWRDTSHLEENCIQPNQLAAARSTLAAKLIVSQGVLYRGSCIALPSCSQPHAPSIQLGSQLDSISCKHGMHCTAASLLPLSPTVFYDCRHAWPQAAHNGEKQSCL